MNSLHREMLLLFAADLAPTCAAVLATAARWKQAVGEQQSASCVESLWAHLLSYSHALVIAFDPWRWIGCALDDLELADPNGVHILYAAVLAFQPSAMLCGHCVLAKCSVGDAGLESLERTALRWG